MKSDFLFVFAFYAPFLGELIRGGAGTECPSPSWVQFRNGCYVFLPAVLRNSLGIDKARELCKISGAEIISIANEEENKFITETFGKKEWDASEDVFLGIFFDTDGNTFKWYDNSEVTFTNWIEDDISEELLNTCAALHTRTGQWRKIGCDNFTEMGTLCKARLFSRGKKFGADQEVVIMSMVIVFSMLVSVAAIVLIVQCKRNVWSLRPSSALRQSASPVPFSDESVLVNGEEREFCA